MVKVVFREERSLGVLKKSSAVTCLLIFGIIYGIRALFETLGFFGTIFKILNNDQFYLAIMVTLYLFLYKPVSKKFPFPEPVKEENFKKFNKTLIFFIIMTWIVAGIFLSIPILRIPMNNPTRGMRLSDRTADVFNLSFFWALMTIGICVFITIVTNKIQSSEKRIAKPIIRNAIIVGGLLAFGLWSLQLVIFELYLNRWLGIELIKQDIRVLIIMTSGLFIVFFYQSLKTRYIPEIKEKSLERIKELLESGLTQDRHLIQNSNPQVTLDNQDSASFSEDEDKEIRFPEGISYKSYLFVLNKIGKSSDIFSSNRIVQILGGVSWIVAITIFITSLFFINSNIFVQVLFLSVICSFFMVLGDFSIILLFNRANPRNNRTPKSLLLKIFLSGTSLILLIWLALFFIIYLYLFIGITNIIVSGVTYIAIFSIVMFALGNRITWWYATSMKMWDAAVKRAPYVKKKASRLNLIWFIANLSLRIFINFIVIPYSSLYGTYFGQRLNLQLTGYFLLIELPLAVFNIGIGMFIVLKIYKRKLRESLTFVLYIQIIILLISVSMHVILGFLRSLVLMYQFNINDVRVFLVVATGIYLISIFTFLKIKSQFDTSEKTKEKFRKEYEDSYIEVTAGNHVILNVKNLTTYFYTEEGVVRAVEGVSFKIMEGETLGLVGETGCGKSVTALSILRLVRPPGEIKSGEVIFEGEDLHQKSDVEFLRYRGNKIAMIFQDPLNSLNPVYKIGDQISEVYLLHMEDELLIEAAKKNTSIYDISRKWSQRMLKDLNIPVPRIIFDRYPHELSGGMRQRVQIAMGLACSPRLLIADEPTTALDVTVQNQILKLMKDLKKKYNTSILFITHDLGIISKMCDRVAVMYSGFIVEYGEIVQLFTTPYHPYTRGLIASVPVVGKKREVLEVIPGLVPNLIYPPSGCRFHPRCQYRFEPCDSEIPMTIEMQPEYFVACHLYDPQYKDLAEISIKKVEKKE